MYIDRHLSDIPLVFNVLIFVVDSSSEDMEIEKYHSDSSQSWDDERDEKQEIEESDEE